MEMGYQETPPPYPGTAMNYGPPSYPVTAINYGVAVQQPMVYPPPSAGPQPVVIHEVQTTTVTQAVVKTSLQDTSAQAVCPRCQRTVVTEVEHTPGLLSWAICGGISVIGCCFFAWIPFIVDACKDVKHLCPNCNTVIHVYKRM
ncbi:lipopolysaccharide-induced tumor necrosis factor-alpha factor homolog [Corythoichthys intestinalis]|uniref:lipopolysaccharide-induced tumor necrosis factor-alpha factor homolog n=1 Tax=Corythoichthys intestinalis TaxID=161448 RepID=UPI0025A600F5|nr:lipopolysaccharide-induced tumor necrosis factor-alpha factor homolog [Corythoichthys intestinalis]